MKRDIFHLECIVDEIDILREILDNKEKEDYLSDEILKRAVTKTLENIGESVKNLSDELKMENSTIEWKDIAGLRDIITHRYHGIDHTLIWDIWEKKIDELYDSVNDILSNFEGNHDN